MREDVLDDLTTRTRSVAMKEQDTNNKHFPVTRFDVLGKKRQTAMEFQQDIGRESVCFQVCSIGVSRQCFR